MEGQGTSHGSRSPLSDITNRAGSARGAGSEGSPPDFGTQDPFQEQPGQFETAHNFFSREPLNICLRPKPEKAELDRVLAGIEAQVTRAQGGQQAWSTLVFGYSSADFHSLEQYLVDLHAQRPATAQQEVIGTINALTGKLRAIDNAYRYIGQDPSFPEFKQVLVRLDAITQLVICWRASAASTLAILSGGRMPAIETTGVQKEAVKLYNFVKFYAAQYGYRVGGPDGYVYVQDIHTLPDGRVHRSPHWRHVTRVPQPGMSRVDPLAVTLALHIGIWPDARVSTS